MKILAIVVTYYPDMKMLMRSIGSYSGSVDRLLVWENTPSAEAKAFRLPESFGAVYASDGNNSLATAYNYAYRYAVSNGYDCILTMDQDSVFRDFAQYRHRAEELLGRETAVVTPDMDTSAESGDFTECNLILNSGAIVPVEALKLTGGYCEDYPIDNLDIDFSICAAENGIRLLRCDGSYMEHHQGNVTKRSLLGRDFKCFNYSPERLYHIFRDIILIYRKHGKPAFLRRVIRDYVVRTYFFRTLLLESGRAEKCFAMLRGIRDGILMKTV